MRCRRLVPTLIAFLITGSIEFQSPSFAQGSEISGLPSLESISTEGRAVTDVEIKALLKELAARLSPFTLEDAKRGFLTAQESKPNIPSGASSVFTSSRRRDVDGKSYSVIASVIWSGQTVERADIAIKEGGFDLSDMMNPTSSITTVILETMLSDPHDTVGYKSIVFFDSKQKPIVGLKLEPNGLRTIRRIVN